MRAAHLSRNVEVREEGGGPPVVLIHGYPFDGDMWSDVSRILARRFRVLRPDLPGRRDTPATAGSIAEYAKWIGAVLAAAGPKVGAAGFSMGGYVLLELLRNAPENLRAAAFVNTHPLADDAAARSFRDAAIAMARETGALGLTRRIAAHLLSRRSLRDPAIAGRVERMILAQSPAAIESDLLAMRDRQDSSDVLPQLKLAALVLGSAEDVISPPARTRAMAEAIPGARYVEIPAAGHLTPVEKPEEVAAALAELFSKAL